MHSRSHINGFVHLALEALETREVPAVGILVDYSLDLRANGGAGFFEDRPAARVVLDQVARELGGRIDANLAAITPSGGNTWSASFYDPRTGGQITLRNPTIPANTLVVYVAGRAMPGPEAGQGGFGGYSWSGSSTWANTVAKRGWSGFATWGGSIAFDTTENWHFGTTTSGLDRNELDFYSVASHELGHLLGLGTAPEWFAQVQSGAFIGSNATSIYGGPVPLQPGGSHWADGVTVKGQPASLDPVLDFGKRMNWSSLDQAALRDIGWAAGSSVTPPVTPPPVTPPSPPSPPPAPPPPQVPPPASGTSGQPVLASGPNGQVEVYTRRGDGTLAFTGRTFTPFAGYTGTVRTAVADFNGDGTLDYAFATGAGTWARVRVVDGSTNGMLVGTTPVLGGFTGGAFIAAGDTDDDGKAELVVSADRGGLPLVELYRVNANRLTKSLAFLPFSAANRNGVRVAMGDLNRDGAADLILGTGAGQAPRVALYDGAALGLGRTITMRTSFLAFDSNVAFGVNIASGDLNGDGYDDLIVSQDVGGSPLVRVWSGASLTTTPGISASSLPLLQEFYANGTDDRNGIRVAARDVDGDGKAELVTAPAGGATGWVRLLAVGPTTVDPVGVAFPFGGQPVVAGAAGGVLPESEGFVSPGGPCLCCSPGLHQPYCSRVSQ